MNGPLPISVVIPVHNRAGMISTAVRAAVAQVPRPPAEVIVADDGSSDDSARLAEEAGATVVRLDTNMGGSAARNAAVESATQPWIAFLDSDDEWLPHHLEKLWERVDDNVLVSSATWVRTKSGDGGFEGSPQELRLKSPADIVTPENPVVTSGTLVRRDALIAAGGFPEGMRLCEDLDTWIRVLELGEGLALPSVSVIYAIHDGQLSRDIGMRDAHRAVVLSYADRPWLTSHVRVALDATLAWDDIGRTLKSLDVRRIIRTSGRALGTPRRIGAVLRLQRLRRRKREAVLAGPPADLG